MGTGKSGQRSVTTPQKTPPPATQHSLVALAVSDLRATMREFTAKLRREFAADIERDAVGFRRDAVYLLSAALSPGPGRQLSKAVTLASELRAQGKSWQVIYAQCIPASLVDDSRQLAQSRLRSAVRSRRNVRRRRKSPVVFSANKM